MLSATVSQKNIGNDLEFEPESAFDNNHDRFTIEGREQLEQHLILALKHLKADFEDSRCLEMIRETTETIASLKMLLNQNIMFADLARLAISILDVLHGRSRDPLDYWYLCMGPTNASDSRQFPVADSCNLCGSYPSWWCSFAAEWASCSEQVVKNAPPVYDTCVMS